MNKNIEIATAPFREGVKEGAAAFGLELKAEWKPLLSLFVAFGLGVALLDLSSRRKPKIMRASPHQVGEI